METSHTLTDTTSVPPIAFVNGSQKAALLPLLAKHVALSIVTLGLYSFWTRAEIRQYVLSNTRFGDGRFGYIGTGTGGSIGFAIGFFCGVIPLVGIPVIAFLSFPQIFPMVLAAAVLIGLFLWGVAEFHIRRFRGNNTVWQDVPLSMPGNGIGYAIVVFLLRLLAILTFGLTVPLLDAARAQRLGRAVWCGEQRVQLSLSAAPLYKKYLLAWVLFPFTLGFSASLYRAAKFRYFAREVRMDDVRFRFDSRTADVLFFELVNKSSILGITLTIGSVGFALMLLIGPLLGFENLLISLGTQIGISAGLALVIFALTLCVTSAILFVRKLEFFFQHIRAKGTIDAEALMEGGSMYDDYPRD